jgi:hemolysin III
MILLGLVWSGAILGIVFRVVWVNAPRWMYVPLYVALGWAAVMYLPQLLAASTAMVVMVLLGGILYSVGAIVYGTKKPNPLPEHFGFHEIFHSLTVLAFICHWVAVVLIVQNPLG